MILQPRLRRIPATEPDTRTPISHHAAMPRLWTCTNHFGAVLACGASAEFAGIGGLNPPSVPYPEHSRFCGCSDSSPQTLRAWEMRRDDCLGRVE